MKKLCLLALGLLAAGAASASTIGYTFENAATYESGDDYTTPDVNDFGDGITVSYFSVTGSSDIRYADIGGGTEAVARDVTGSVTYSFTLTIDDLTTVDLTNIAFDSSYRCTLSTDTTLDWDFSTTVGSDEAINVKAGLLSYDGSGYTTTGSDYDLTGLTDLTDTTVTFSWTYTGSKNNTYARAAFGIDDISLTGAVAAIPEPATIGMLGLGTVGLLAFRRRMS